MEIHWRHPNAISPSEREFAMNHLEHLVQGHTDLTDLWIDVSEGSAHHRKGDKKVTIRCQARRASIVAIGTGAESGLALRSAIEKFEREIWRLRDRRAEHRPRADSAPLALGIVDRVMRDEDYGFLLTDSGVQVYFHRNALNEGLDFAALEEGQRVALDFYAGSEGPQASVVTRPPPDASQGP